MSTRRTTRNHIEERHRQRRRRSQIRWIVAASVGAVIVFLALIALNTPRTRPDVTSVASDYEGLTQEIDTTGLGVGLSIGDPQAPNVLVEYSDFSCPHCYDLGTVVDRIIQEDVRAGRLRIIFKPVSIINPPYSTEAAKAAICAARQGRFWEMHDQIWMVSQLSGPGAYSESAFTESAAIVGLDVEEFTACYRSAQTAADADAVNDEAAALGINGTPTMFFNGDPFGYYGVDQTYTNLKNAIAAAGG